MGKFQPPTAIKDGNKCQLSVDLCCYSHEAVTAAVYKFTDKYYIQQQSSPKTSDILFVFFESKDGAEVFDVDVKQFCNELIDQQVRVYVNKEFGKIRDMIVEEAFKPISK